MKRLVCLLWAAVLALPGAVFAGPELADGVVVVPAGPGCPLAAPRVAVFDNREVWLWRKSPQIEGALFRDGATTPDPRGFLSPADEEVFGGLRLAQDGTRAWAAWAVDSGLSLELQQIPGSGDEPLEPTVPVSALSAFDLAVTPNGGALVVYFVPHSPFTRGGPFLTSVVLGPEGTVAGERTTFARRDIRSGPWVTPVGDGTLAVSWREVDAGRVQIATQRLSAAGRPLGEPVVAFRQEPDAPIVTPVGVAPWFGGLALAWGERGPEGQRIAWTFLDLDLEPVTPVRRTTGGPFPVSGLDRLNPIDLATAPDGRLLMVWESRGRIVGQYLGTPGGLLNEPFEISLPASGESRNPDVAFGPDGRLVVVWEQRPVNPPFDSECAGSAFALHGRRSAGLGCPAGALCLLEDRFEVTVAWDDPLNGGSGLGVPVPVNEESGSFWFFDDENLELMVKVIDGRAVNGHFWVFFGSLTNVGFEITVHDRVTGAEKTYANPPGTFASRGDTTAFDASP